MMKDIKAIKKIHRQPDLENTALSIFSFTTRGGALSNKLSSFFDDIDQFGPADIKDGRLKKITKALFAKNGRKGKRRAVVFIGATGIAVRSIAPFIRDKTCDPAVIVIDERARFVISLLSGHLGGANSLASFIADKLNATEVITTATDLAGLPSVEDIALGFSLEIENSSIIKKINAAILRGELVPVIDPNPLRRCQMLADKKLKKAFIFKSRITKRPTGHLVVVSFESIAKLKLTYKGSKDVLFLRPKEFVVGIGCRRGVTIKEIKEAYDSVLSENNISPLSIRNIASIDIKSNERGLLGFSDREGLEIEFIEAKKIRKITPPSGTSKIVQRLVNVAGVAEPSALVSAQSKREKAKIWIKKQKFPRVTIAVARVPYTS